MRLSTNWVAAAGRQLGIAAAAFLALSTVACGRTPIPETVTDDGFVVTAPQLRGAKIDMAASSFILEGVQSKEQAGPWAEDFYKTRHDDIGRALDHMLGASGDSKPARFRVRVTDFSGGPWGLATCFLVLHVFGCPLGSRSIQVELELEVDGVTYKAPGEGTQVLFAYANQDDEIAYAIVEAMRDIDQQALRQAQ